MGAFQNPAPKIEVKASCNMRYVTQQVQPADAAEPAPLKWPSAGRGAHPLPPASQPTEVGRAPSAAHLCPVACLSFTGQYCAPNGPRV